MVALYIFIELVLFLLLFIAKNNKNIIARRFNIAIIILWIGLFLISYSNPYDLFPVSEKVYLLLLIFVISFTIGITFAYNHNEFNIREDFIIKAKDSLDKLVDKKAMMYASIICLLVLLYAFFRQQSALQYATISEYRVEGTQDYLFGERSWIGIIYNLFVTPFSYVLYVLFAYLLVFRREKRFFLIISALVVVLSTSINNARGILLIVIVFVVFVVWCCPFFSQRIKMGKQLRNILILTAFIFGAISFVSYLTAQRMFGENEFSKESVEMGVETMNKHIVTYFVGPFRSFEYALDNDYFNQLNGPTFGRSTFGFIEGFLGFVLQKIGIPFQTANGRIYNKLQNEWIYVGWSTNFAYTSLFNYYMDFGYLGILFLPAFFGAIIKKLCNKYLCNHNPAIMLLLGYLFYASYECYFGWILYYWPVAFYFIIIIILYKYSKRKILKT